MNTIGEYVPSGFPVRNPLVLSLRQIGLPPLSKLAGQGRLKFEMHSPRTRFVL